MDWKVETAAQLAPRGSDRLLWGDLANGYRLAEDAFAPVARSWRDAWLSLAGQGWLLAAMALVLACGLISARAWALPAWERHLQKEWRGHPLALSLPAAAGVLVQGGLAWLAASLFLQALVWTAPLPLPLRGTARALVAVVTLMAVVIATGRGIARLTVGLQGGRAGMATAPLVLALSLLLVALLDRNLALMAAPPAAAVGLVHAATACAMGVAIAFVLSRAPGIVRRAGLHTPVRRRLAHAVSGGVMLGWLLLVVVVASLLAGYMAWAAFLTKQIVWTLLVLGWTFLAWRTVHDGADFLAGRREALLRASRRTGVGTRRLQQAIVLVSGAAMLGLACVALMLISAPYGLGPSDLLGRMFDAGGNLRIGNLSFSPVQVLRAMVVLALAVAASRMLAQWLCRRLLPTTRLDAGVRASLTTLARYAGVVVGIGMALAALGVEANRITWVVSALTVGIGFGLQAIVQNFISGLILLVERPVKVGDWVVVGDAEGDVRRINVRATEISLADRTTVLVPNSELITKVVRNRTFTAGDGLVKVVLPVPAVADIAQVVGLVRAVVREQGEIKPSPAPQVQVEEVRDNKLWIGVSAYVEGPRQVTRIRAALLLALVQRLQAAGIALV